MNVLKALRPPDLFTLVNVTSGFLAILVASEMRSSEAAKIAFLLIALAAAADGLDGFVARKTGSGPLGANLDSLADLISFGAAPAFLAIHAYQLPPIIWPMAVLFLICGTLRLARFNISSKDDRLFEGLPIPAAGIALSASVLLGWPDLTVLFMPVLALLMISSIPYPKIRNVRSLALLSLISVVAVVAVFFQTKIIYTTILVGALILLYLISPVVVSRLQKRK